MSENNTRAPGVPATDPIGDCCRDCPLHALGMDRSQLERMAAERVTDLFNQAASVIVAFGLWGWGDGNGGSIHVMLDDAVKREQAAR